MDSQTDEKLIATVAKRLKWILVASMFIAFMDRTNISFVASYMNQDIGLSAKQFGIGASLFFLGYMLFEVPSNLVMARVGARRWLARIMITWGLISSASAFISGPIGFYLARFMLGVAEAGFIPGVMLYLSYWSP
jgi:ACS family tartrate transporter-like MFS transporter